MTNHKNGSNGNPSAMLLPGLDGKRVAVTAGASGIGFAIAKLFHEQGVRVAICDIDSAALDKASLDLGGCIAEKADVSDNSAVEAFFYKVQNEFGGLDALVNNAGIAGPTGNLEDLSPDDWRRCIDVCLTGQFLCARQAIPMIKASGGGAIVNMASAAAKHGYAYRTPYSAAKFGVVGLTQSLAKELGPDNIRVNAVLPGIIEGPRMEGVIRDRAMTSHFCIRVIVFCPILAYWFIIAAQSGATSNRSSSRLACNATTSAPAASRISVSRLTLSKSKSVITTSGRSLRGLKLVICDI